MQWSAHLFTFLHLKYHPSPPPPVGVVVGGGGGGVIVVEGRHGMEGTIVIFLHALKILVEQIPPCSAVGHLIVQVAALLT